MEIKPKKLFFSGSWYRKTAVWLATIVAIIILFFVAVDFNFCYLFGRSPGLDDINDPVVNEASEVYTCDGVLMGRYFNENRTPVTYEEISPVLIYTLVDTEDERFYRHHGIDVLGLFSTGKDILLGRVRGGSTITQQLAKNLFRVRTQYSTGLLGRLPGIKILVMKAKEWIVAIKLERVFSKEEILTMYLNTVDFGSNAYGIKTAARTYFGTTPDALTYEQAATLVGLLKATSYYNPRLNPENSFQRNWCMTITTSSLTGWRHRQNSWIPSWHCLSFCGHVPEKAIRMVWLLIFAKHSRTILTRSVPMDLCQDTMPSTSWISMLTACTSILPLIPECKLMPRLP